MINPKPYVDTTRTSIGYMHCALPLTHLLREREGERERSLFDNPEVTEEREREV
jgi:hypothetical protein